MTYLGTTTELMVRGLPSTIVLLELLLSCDVIVVPQSLQRFNAILTLLEQVTHVQNKCSDCVSHSFLRFLLAWSLCVVNQCARDCFFVDSSMMLFVVLTMTHFMANRGQNSSWNELWCSWHALGEHQSLACSYKGVAYMRERSIYARWKMRTQNVPSVCKVQKFCTKCSVTNSNQSTRYKKSNQNLNSSITAIEQAKKAGLATWCRTTTMMNAPFSNYVWSTTSYIRSVCMRNDEFWKPQRGKL